MEFVRTLVQEKTGLKINQPDSRGGTTSTDSIARRAFTEDSSFIDCILTVVASQHRCVLSRIHSQLSVILRLYNSNEKIKTKALGYQCKDTYIKILESFPWSNISPTLHKVLAHSEELVRDFNSGHGLKDFSEEGTEACNKLIRRDRELLARKTSFESNTIDIFVRLASESDPVLIKFRKILVCELCGEHGYSRRAKCCNGHKEPNSNIGLLFESLVYK